MICFDEHVTHILSSTLTMSKLCGAIQATKTNMHTVWQTSKCINMAHKCHVCGHVG